jgi:hypothetical protein
MHNALTYDFDQLQSNSAVVELTWEDRGPVQGFGQRA